VPTRFRPVEDRWAGLLLIRDGLLAADPDDCFGAPYFFTTDTVPS